MRTEQEVQARLAHLHETMDKINLSIKNMRSKKGLGPSARKTFYQLQANKIALSASLFELNWILNIEQPQANEPTDISAIPESEGASGAV